MDLVKEERNEEEEVVMAEFHDLAYEVWIRKFFMYVVWYKPNMLHHFDFCYKELAFILIITFFLSWLQIKDDIDQIMKKEIGAGDITTSHIGNSMGHAYNLLELF